MASMSAEERAALIKENLAEVLDWEVIQNILDEGRDPVFYFGTATTGRPHCGYFVPGLKIAQFLKAGVHMKILLADIHAFLDNLKAPIEIVEYRAKYYEFCIRSLLQACGVDTSKLEFILGSSYQTGSKYVMDVFKLASVVSEHDAKKSGAEVVKQSANAPLSGLLYPILQVLDEEHLNVDAQFGGLDQRKLFIAGKEWLPRLEYRQRAHLMNPMVPGLQGGKMSASDPDSKIDLLDPPDVVTKKLRKAECVPRVEEGNGVLAFCEYVLLPASALKSDGKPQFRVDRSRDNLEDLVYTSVEQMREDYRNDVLTPQLLKPAVTKALTELMAPIQAAFQASKEWQEIAEKAYPPPEVKKKVKKVKDKGSRHPGAAKGEGAPKPEESKTEENGAPAGAEAELPVRSA
ncbi:Tyrosine--tRNA ligase [Pleurostoma richardsiae]|uniref:Tyrosine--tRNA ligase n=1 Tax=Pleurostoma richardsiae TaxID=41990 RepID=A0AA38VNP0_9PEZI|nr:Tyrosine--tRNA ligase [Pleurostoma richardsiae]